MRRLWTAIGLTAALLATTSTTTRAAGYGVTLTGLTASTRADGTGTVLSMTADGDLKGLVTIDLDPGGTKGTWTFMVAYVQDFYADGTPAVRPPSSEEEEAAHPTTPRQINKGSLSGTISGASIGADANGRTIVTFGQLTVTSGSVTFLNAKGVGAISTSTGNGTSATTLSLTF